MNLKESKIGFVVNPLAGIGGRVGLKGSDGEEIVGRALDLGAKPVAPQRADEFLRELKMLESGIQIVCYPDGMGEDEVRKAGFDFKVIGSVQQPTTAEDTKRAVKGCVNEGVELIVFVGGDGTARDVLDAIKEGVPVIGVPSGVKMYSAVFASTPKNAAKLVSEYLDGRVAMRLGEVLDVDEEGFRRDFLTIKLYGYLLTLSDPILVQPSKMPTVVVEDEAENQLAIARRVVKDMMDDEIYILGSGTTTKAIADLLNLPKTLLGVDVIKKDEVIVKDANESQILEVIKCKKAKIIVSPIGRQGYIFGRGNQQISPAVIRQVGKNGIIVVATRGKRATLDFLRVDTGDIQLDKELEGYYRVIVDYNEIQVIRCVA
ncbi:MAG: ATP-NAD kinase family protein [Nitrososphaerales archaeon]